MASPPPKKLGFKRSLDSEFPSRFLSECYTERREIVCCARKKSGKFL